MPFVHVHWYEGRSDDRRPRSRSGSNGLVDVARRLTRSLLGEVRRLLESGLHHRREARGLDVLGIRAQSDALELPLQARARVRAKVAVRWLLSR